ncbi:serine/threonine-protein phosphatase [bacterium]|nr:serine/threonine-protein phosphatase [bacterium]
MQIVKRWRRLALNRQLLISVNSVLSVFVGLFLILDHQSRIAQQIEQKQISLNEEAKTIYESVQALADPSQTKIQSLIDNVCAWMNLEESPGHHIVVEVDNVTYQANSHGLSSPEMLQAIQSQHGENPLSESMVVGTFERLSTKVYVSERRSSIISEAREQLAFQIVAMLVAGLVAAWIVNRLLGSVVSGPIEQIVLALHQMEGRELQQISDSHSCKELSYLTEQINLMIYSLNAAEQDRHVQMEKARKIQEHLLPKYETYERLNVAHLFEPAEEVGGDYFDVLQLSEDGYLLCLADVTGHGVPAAMAATVMKALVLEAVQSSASPGEILTLINQRYSNMIMPGHFATMAILILDLPNHKITYSNAGHEPPLICQRNGEVIRLLEGGIVLGVDDQTIYTDATVRLKSHSKIVIASDGVTEAFDPEENQFGFGRFAAVLKTSATDSPSTIVEGVRQSLIDFRRSRPPFDDTTLLVVEACESQNND